MKKEINGKTYYEINEVCNAFDVDANVVFNKLDINGIVYMEGDIYIDDSNVNLIMNCTIPINTIESSMPSTTTNKPKEEGENLGYTVLSAIACFVGLIFGVITIVVAVGNL